jgi:hypothetical protein
MESVVINDWHAFVAWSEALDGWAFRGHQSADWTLQNSLSRQLRRFSPDDASWRVRESRALRIFRRKAHIYLDARDAIEDDLRCLAMMQHHGAPTRLLDFTKSPFVAAFFALESATSNAAVFALNTPALWNLAPDFDPALTREVIDPRRPGAYAKYFAENQNPILWCGEPAEMDRRLVAQSGLFVVPGQLHVSLEQILRHYETRQPLLKKIILPYSLRHRAMQSLYRMNITNATLFPDLDGLARSIAYELEVLWETASDPAGRTPGV